MANELCEDYVQTKLSIVEQVINETIGGKIIRLKEFLTIENNFLAEGLGEVSLATMAIITKPGMDNYIMPMNNCIDTYDRNNDAAKLVYFLEKETNEEWKVLWSKNRCPIHEGDDPIDH